MKVLENYCLLATRNKNSVERAMQSFSELLDKDQDYLPAVLGMSTGFMIEKSQVRSSMVVLVVVVVLYRSLVVNVHVLSTAIIIYCLMMNNTMLYYGITAQGAQPAEACGQDGGEPARRRRLREGQPAARQVLHRQGELVGSRDVSSSG